MKISEYPLIEEITNDDVLVAATNKGTKKVPIKKLVDSIAPTIEDSLPESPIITDPVIIHRNSFRGENLGDEITDDQISSIQNGTFDNLYVGDYWEIDGIKWYIADINYLKNLDDSTDTRIGTKSNNLLLFPNKIIGNVTGNTIGSPFGSSYTNYLKNNAGSLLPTSIKNNLLTDLSISAYTQDFGYNTECANISYITTGIFPPSATMLTGNGFDSNKDPVAGRSVFSYPQCSLFKIDRRFATIPNSNGMSFYLNCRISSYPVTFGIKVELVQLTYNYGIRPVVAIG